jgi:hypothetical protein
VGVAVGILRRLSKLRAMSGREIATRVAYAATLAAERRQHERGTLVRPDNLRRALLPTARHGSWERRLLDSRRQASRRFFPSIEQRQELRALFADRYAAEGETARRAAAAARDGQFQFFGRNFSYSRDIPWQKDPVTGADWPAVFHADVPVHGGDVGYGDVKHVWELSRQQYLIDLGKAYFLFDDTASLAAVRALVRSWIAGNPYATGVNWACALEPAFRAWSWLWAYHFTADALDEEFHLQWLDAFQLHGRFIATHLEHYSSPFNHLIGEASALYALAIAFPEFAAARAWKRIARDVLVRRLPEQFYDDGGTKEQSAFYHHATLGFYLLAALLARINREELPASVWAAVERGLEFSQRLMLPDGFTPEIGGADDGKPIRLELLPLWDFRPYLAAGAVLLGRPDMKATSKRFYEDALWLLGTRGMESYDALTSADPNELTAVLPSSGYYIARSGWSNAADYVCFDVGEQAAGMRTDAVPNSMHGHADCLSLVVALQGSRVLVDSGLYAYNCGGLWEAHFRETAAHSTARVDGRDQALHIGKMAWSHSYRATLDLAGTAAGRQWALGSHDGYARGPQGVIHRRSVWLRADHYVIVRDEFTGAGAHHLEVNFQFAPGVVALDGAQARMTNVADLAWTGTVPWTAEVATAGEAPDQGWIARSLGVRVPAPRLRLSASMSGGRAALMTVLAAPAGRVTRVATSEGLLRVVCGDAQEWIAIDHDSAAFQAERYPALCRLGADGRVVEALALGDAPVRVDDALVADVERRFTVQTTGR